MGKTKEKTCKLGYGKIISVKKKTTRFTKDKKNELNLLEIKNENKRRDRREN